MKFQSLKGPVDRQTYLKSHWEKYSFAPQDYVACGKLQSISVDGDLLTLNLQNQSFKLKISEQKKKDYQFAQVLDDVAITKKNEMTLLTPRSSGTHVHFQIDPQLQWLWSRFLHHIRDFFTEENFLELNTASLVQNPGPEPTIEVFETEFLMGSKSKKLFLPTSPEIEIKKHLVALSLELEKPRVFEITKSYRNSEWTERHRPEFFILEWYRTYEDLDSIQQDIQNLVQKLSQNLKTDVQSKKWSHHVQFPAGPSLRKSFKDLFKQQFQFDLQPQSDFKSLFDLAHRLGIDTHSAENFDDLFFLIYLHKIENQWNPETLFFIEKYPPSQAALARLDHDGWGERFEFYWKGFEIANAFCELNDPEVQSERLKKDLEEKKRLGKKAISFDEEFIRSLQLGLPPTSGVALGLERLFMALLGIQKFQDLKLAHIKA